ncbi:CNP1-like family protein [Herbaspirillum sp. RV1423]|uniref:CNP1-like family protein n=1 Tax=Herbaspirillum sp. RV1423 TaxID=1443993 RepID=UPI0005596DC4|nr:CNP1-like family protein [Herbaspirillum sp. RV1423]
MPPRFRNTPSLSRRLARCLVAGLLLASATLSFAQQLGSFDEEFDDEEKPWQEIAVQLPPAPQQENLVDFYVSPVATSTSYIDLKSLSVGSDNVVRYTLVTKTNGGAVNISYEGIRCETYEKKIYAFGHPDGKWSRSRQDKWRRINDAGSNRQDAALYKSYFCQNGILSGDAKKIIARLREKRPIDPSRE